MECTLCDMIKQNKLESGSDMLLLSDYLYGTSNMLLCMSMVFETRHLGIPTILEVGCIKHVHQIDTCDTTHVGLLVTSAYLPTLNSQKVDSKEAYSEWSFLGSWSGFGWCTILEAFYIHLYLTSFKLW